MFDLSVTGTWTGSKFTICPEQKTDNFPAAHWRRKSSGKWNVPVNFFVEWKISKLHIFPLARDGIITCNLMQIKRAEQCVCSLTHSPEDV